MAEQYYAGMMEEEIDLRAYVEVLLRYWIWIAGLALVAALSAFVVSSSMAPTYEAKAVVMITEPRYQMQFDPRFETSEQWKPAYEAFPTLAASDDVLQEVVNTYTPSPAAEIEEWKVARLGNMVEASSEGDPSLVVLKVTSTSPKDAATIANTWAQVLVDRGNDLYSSSEKDVTFFQKQVAQAEEALEKAEENLIAFEARNEASTVNAQLNSLQRQQSDYLADQRSIAYLIQDIKGLRAQLAQQPGDQPSSLADDLTTLFLQVKAFNAEASAPIQLQLNSAASFSNKSLSEQIRFLDDLSQTLEAKSTEIEEHLAALEPKILALQEQLQEIKTEKQRLNRAQELAQETYLTISRKLEEARIAAQEENGVLQVGSKAAVPERPVGPRRKMNTAIAGALGLMMGVFGVFVVEWWQDEEADTLDEEKS